MKKSYMIVSIVINVDTYPPQIPMCMFTNKLCMKEFYHDCKGQLFEEKSWPKYGHCPPHKYGMLGEGFVLWFMFKLTKMHPQKFGKLTQKKLDKKFLYILMYRGRGIDQVEALAPTQLL